MHGEGMLDSMSDVQVPVGDAYALVDAEDYERVSAHTWHATCGRNGTIYARTSARKPDGKWTTVLMHRLIMDAPTGVQVDHVNHDGLDNRKSELRLATATQNRGNTRPQTNNASGRKGVSLHRATGKWQALVQIDGKRRHLGLFTDLDAAGAAYDAAAVECFGDFALTNEMLTRGY